MTEYLRQDNLTVFEKSHTENGKTVTILFSRSREVPECALPQMFEDTGRPVNKNKVQRLFSTNSESPFASFKPALKQTGIFVDRFFHGFSYADLAVKYKLSEDAAPKIFHNGVKRVTEILMLMDREKPVDVSQFRRQIEERSGKIPKAQKFYLLNKLFNLRPVQIAEMEGVPENSSLVRQLIIRVSDQLKAGEIRLIDASPDEAAKAEERLDEVRRKRRERYGRRSKKRAE